MGCTEEVYNFSKENKHEHSINLYCQKNTQKDEKFVIGHVIYAWSSGSLLAALKNFFHFAIFHCFPM